MTTILLQQHPNMFRVRDIVALVAALVLSRMAWNSDELDAVGASLHLSWYLPRHSSKGTTASSINIAPKLLDIDGDGITEAIVVVREDKILQIYDLRKASQQQFMAPFRPPLLIQSEPALLPSDSHPLHLATAHIYMKGDDDEARHLDTAYRAQNIQNDRTKHYYCGIDWHDASTKCRTHCPNGLSSDCPDGETCYADTPCDASVSDDHMESKQRFAFDAMYTPQGSIPAVATLWDNGEVTMHALALSNSTRKLEFRLLWNTNVLANHTILNWENDHLTLLDAKAAGNGQGLVLLTGSVDLDYRDGEEPLRVAFVAAMNAKNGRVQWESLSDDEMLNPKPKLPLPLQDDLRSSFARRRRSFSHSINRNRHRQVQQKENCMHFYRRSILASGILPFLYWDHMFVQTKALHFDSQQKLEKQFYHAKRAGNKMKSSWFTGKQGNAAHRHQPMLHYGKPNVVATINEHGLQIRSIRNGRLLCHLSFWANTLYTDLNHDGTLDSVSLVMSGRSLRDDDDQGEKRKWVSKLIKNIAKVRGDVNAMRQVEAAIETQTILEAHLCHLTVLSGLPAKEELFSTFLCGPSNLHDAEEFHASPAPPLVVEAIHGSARDVVVAVSTGYVTRVHGTTGRVVWQNGQLKASDPLWEDDAVSALTRVESMMLAPESRPILLHGERSLAIYSARHGKLLESLSYPQSSRSKPITDDFNGDGTSDVIIGTDDALWGYIIHVQVGSPLLFRVAVGLLLMLMMLALLRNRFGPQPGRRSSDA